ncbi:hypothetical protein R0J88_23470, partial [Pseudoalteromonas sp. SIMBA_162]
IAPHAAVGETAGAARGLGKGWATGVLNACLRRFQREQEALEAMIREHPLMIDERDFQDAVLESVEAPQLSRDDWRALK